MKNKILDHKIKNIDELIKRLQDFLSSGVGIVKLRELMQLLVEEKFKEFVDLTSTLLETRKLELKELRDGSVYIDDWFKHLHTFQKVLVNHVGYWEPAFFSCYGSDAVYGAESRNVAICMGFDVVFPKELIKPFSKEYYMKDDEEVYNILRNKYPDYE